MKSVKFFQYNDKGLKTMITVRIKGGLGNQLFQYAAGYALSKRLGQEMKLDTSFYTKQTLRSYKLAFFAITHCEIQRVVPLSVSIVKEKYLNKLLRISNISLIPFTEHNVYLLETRPDIVQEYFTISKQNIYMDGYYHSEKYFGKYRTELLRQFLPCYTQQEQYTQALEKIQSSNSVAVHVRRGDYLKLQYDNNPRHYLLGENYYMNAIKYMENRLDNPKFFWFSDDIEWVKQKFGNRKDFSYIKMNTEHSDIDELMLMKNTNHIISANSTFSWWASWLNEHENVIHICPSKNFGNKYMFPSNWVKIDV